MVSVSAQSLLRLFLFLLLIFCIAFVAYALDLQSYFSLLAIQEKLASLMTFSDNLGVLAPILFGIAYVLFTIFALPFASVLTLLAGALFGLWLGVAVVVISATVGACGLFLVARSALGRSLRAKVSAYAPKIRHQIEKNGFFYLLSLRLVPVFPFFAVNILPALFPFRLRTYAGATLLGILPASAVYVNIGQNLASLTSLSGLVSPAMLGAFSLLAGLAILPVVIKKYLPKKTA